MGFATGAYGKAGNGNEMETGNRKWNGNGNGNKNAPITGAMFSSWLMSSVLSCILLSNGFALL